LSCHGCSVAERSRPICPVLATPSQFRNHEKSHLPKNLSRAKLDLFPVTPPAPPRHPLPRSLAPPLRTRRPRIRVINKDVMPSKLVIPRSARDPGYRLHHTCPRGDGRIRPSALRCHPEEAESHAQRATLDEGPMHLACSEPTDAI
jgi:hypothetical protein